MRTIRSLLSPLAVAALVATARPVTAQDFAVATNTARTNKAPAATDVVPRTVAIYRFERSRDVGMPIEVALADSAGTLIGSYRIKDGSAARPMTVDILGADLHLQAQTASGVLTIVVYEMGDPVLSSILLGRWMLGDKQGELLRRTAR